MKRLLPLLLLIAIVGFAGWRWYTAKPIDLTLSASGTIEAETARVGSTLGGRVLQVLAREGDRVAAAQPLVQLETDLVDLQIRQQQAAIAARNAELDRARTGPRSEETTRARLEWAAAQTDLGRLQPLFDQGVIGRRELDAAKVREATLRETLRLYENGTRKEDIAAAAAAVAREQEQLAYLERQRRELVIVAPYAGTLERLDLRAGDIVAAGQPVGEVLADEDLWVRVYVPEPELGRVAVGHAVSVTIDTFPERAFAGKVVEIRNRGEYTPRNIQTPETRVDQVFGVKVAIERNGELKPGMAATVRFVEAKGGR